MEPDQQRHHPSPKIVLFAGVLAVSTASVFIRFAQTEASSLTIAAYRLGLATLMLAPFALRGRLAEFRHLSRPQISLVILSGVFLAIHFATWITSLEYTSVASSAVFVTTDPLWVALLSPLLLREKLTRPVVIGLVITLLGGLVVAISDTCTWDAAGFACPSMGGFFGGRTALGNSLALAGAWMAAGYLIVGRRLRGGMSLLAYTFLVYGVAAVVLVGLAVAVKAPLWGFSPVIFLWFFALALIPQVIGHSTFNWALRYLPATLVSIAILGEPIGSTLLAYLLLNEVPPLAKIGGAVLILFGIWVASRNNH